MNSRVRDNIGAVAISKVIQWKYDSESVLVVSGCLFAGFKDINSISVCLGLFLSCSIETSFWKKRLRGNIGTRGVIMTQEIHDRNIPSEIHAHGDDNSVGKIINDILRMEFIFSSVDNLKQLTKILNGKNSVFSIILGVKQIPTMENSQDMKNF